MAKRWRQKNELERTCVGSVKPIQWHLRGFAFAQEILFKLRCFHQLHYEERKERGEEVSCPLFPFPPGQNRSFPSGREPKLHHFLHLHSTERFRLPTLSSSAILLG